MAILDERFADIDRRLAEALKNARSSTTHRGVRGDELAGILGQQIRDHFIDCASFHKGCEIRDTRCALSQEVDLVLLNRFHPAFLLKPPRVLFIEGVLAAAEVKTSLDKGETVDCLAKARTFKRLQSNLTANDRNAHRVDNPDDVDRYVVRRPFFAFAYEDSRDLQTVLKNVEEWTNDNNVPCAEQIDAIFVLNKGIVVNLGSGAGAIEMKGKGADPLSGFVRKGTSSIFSQLILWMSLVCPSFTALDPILVKYASFNTDGYTR